MKKINLVLLVTTGLLLAVACGDDGEGGAPTVGTSVDDSKTISSLSSEEIVDVCEDVYTGMNAASEEIFASSEDAMCLSVGVSAASMVYVLGGDAVADADMVTACEEAVTACKSEESEVVEETDMDEVCASAEMLIGDCDITIGQMLECFNAELAASKAEMDAVAGALPSCSEMSAATLESMEEVETPEETMPAACETVYTACPALAMM